MKSYETKARINQLKNDLSIKLMHEVDAKTKIIREIEQGTFKISEFLSDSDNLVMKQLKELQESINAPDPLEID